MSRSDTLSIDTGPLHPPLLTATIGEAFTRAVGSFAEREAVVEHHTGRRWTYAELDREVRATAAMLQGLGVRKGDRVGIWAPNCAEWLFVQFATALLGAVQVNINPAYRAPELVYALNQSGVRTLVCARSFKSSDYVAMVDQARPQCPGLFDVLVIGSREWDAGLQTGREADPAELDAGAQFLHPSDPINIQYTSGTTGFPKGATLCHHNILNNGYLTGHVAHFTAEDRLCVPVPFYHCFGMVCGTLAAITHGACVVIPSPSFHAPSMLSAIAAERCTVAYGVPTMFIAALNDPTFGDHDLSSLRTGFTGGAPAPTEMMKRVLDLMPEFSILFGMTELSPVATQTRREDPLSARTASVGRAAPHVEVKIVNPATGHVVARREAGELCVRGYSVMLGYWNEPAKTAEVIDPDGWMHTGDVASMDEDGFVSITGRIKDMVIRGGENIYPREVEEFLHTHPDVVEAQVVGVPDDILGEELIAWLRLRPGAAPLGPDAVREFCAGRLAHYKIPRYVHVTDEFPMTVTGKVRKIEMREISIGLLGLADSGIAYGERDFDA